MMERIGFNWGNFSVAAGALALGLPPHDGIWFTIDMLLILFLGIKVFVKED